MKEEVRKCKDKWWDKTAEEMNQHFVMHNHRQFFQTLERWKNGKRATSTALKLKDGKTVTSDEAKLCRWREHFNDLLNVNNKCDLTQLNRLKEYKEIKELAIIPQKGEVIKDIKDLNCNKAAGPDGITAEMLKAGSYIISEWLTQFFERAWTSVCVPKIWKDAIMVPLHKKKELDDCNDYRGISLLSIVGKTFARLILNRIKSSVEDKIHEIQAAFRTGRSCIDQIFTLRLITERAKESNTPIFLCFVDIQKAYDSVNRDALWDVLKKYGFPVELVQIIKELHTGNQAMVRAMASYRNLFHY